MQLLLPQTKGKISRVGIDIMFYEALLSTANTCKVHRQPYKGFNKKVCVIQIVNVKTNYNIVKGKMKRTYLFYIERVIFNDK